jgi:hypothetical protein
MIEQLKGKDDEYKEKENEDEILRFFFFIISHVNINHCD